MIITYEDLKNCAALAREVTEIRERMERICAMAERCTTVTNDVGGRGSPITNDRIGEWVGRLDEMRRDADKRIEAYMDHVFEVDVAISSIPNSTQRRILRLRYMDGLTWEEVSERTHYNERWCRRLHKRGLLAIGIEKETSPEKTTQNAV